MKTHSKLTWNFRIKIQIPILLNISVLLDIKANLPETSPFFVCPNGFGEHLISNLYSIYLGCITLVIPRKKVPWPPWPTTYCWLLIVIIFPSGLQSCCNLIVIDYSDFSTMILPKKVANGPFYVEKGYVVHFFLQKKDC